MLKLKRRTCPGYDARRSGPSPPLAQANIAYSDGAVVPASEDESAKVSRTASPPSLHPAVGRGSLGSAKSVVSEDKASCSYQRVVSNDSENEPSVLTSDSEDVGPIKKYCKKKDSLSGEEDSGYSDLPPKELSFHDETREHQLTVAEVSRDLNFICASHAETLNAGKSHRKTRDRSANLPWFRKKGNGIASRPVYGLEKPCNFYFGPGKFDLCEYDCEDGEDLFDEYQAGVTSNANMKRKSAPSVVVPTTSAASSESALTKDDIETLTPSMIYAHRIVLSALLALCLGTDPKDPDLPEKISAHLNDNPSLNREFAGYLRALSGDVSANSDRGYIFDNDPYDFKTFGGNFLKRVNLDWDKLSPSKSNTVKRCVAAWWPACPAPGRGGRPL